MQESTSILKAAESLREGSIGVFPTETVYGLGANALDARAVAKVFALKSRPEFNPLIIHTTPERAFRWAKTVPESARQLAEKFWPGPLAIVLEKHADIPYLVTGGLETVAIRVPNHPVAQALLAACEFPVAAPSANFFQTLSPTQIDHLDPKLKAGTAFVLDGGPCRVGVESTIVAFLPEPVVLRAGGISLEALREILPDVKLYEAPSGERPLSPGMLAKHYAPTTALRVYSPKMAADTHPRRGALFFGKPFAGTFATSETLSASGDLNEAARNLFHCLRVLDRSNVDEIVFEWVPNQGLGLAINDRLRRALTA